MVKIRPILGLLLLLLAITGSAQKKFIGPNGSSALKEDPSVILVRLKDMSLQKSFIGKYQNIYNAKDSKPDVIAFKVSPDINSVDLISQLEKDINIQHVYHGIWQDDTIPIILNGNITVGVKADQSLDDAIKAAGLTGQVIEIENPFNTWMERNGKKENDTMAVMRWLKSTKDEAFDVANALYNTGLVSYADPDFYTPISGSGIVTGYAPSPNDPLYVGQSSYLADLGKLDSANLWSNYAKTVYTSAYRGMYIVDDGLDLSLSTKQPDLNNIYGYGAFASTAGGIPGAPGLSHGTFTAGIAGAIRNNSLLIAGVVDGPTIKSVKLLSGGESIAQIAAGFGWLRFDGYRVVSNSWSFATPSTAGYTAIESQINSTVFTGGPGGSGCFVVFSSGNNTGTSTVMFPGNMADVFTVGAVEGSWGTRCSYSNYGPAMDAVATVPPSGVVSLDRVGSLGANANDYVTGITGVSFAVPQVAAIGYMISCVAPSLTGAQIGSVIRATATHIGPGTGLNYEFGWGWPSALKAIAEALHRDTATKIVPLPIVSAAYRDFELKVIDASSAAVLPYNYSWSISIPGLATLNPVSGYSTGRRIRVSRTASATGYATLEVKFGPIDGIWITRQIGLNFNSGAVARSAASATDSTEEILPEEMKVSKSSADKVSYDEELSIVAGPVPAHNDLHLSLVNSAKKPISFDFIQFKNLNGQEVYTRKCGAGTYGATVNVSGLNTGIYTVLIRTGDKVISKLISIN